ncbi:amino acid carrier protein [Peptoniphilus sp. ING2-D1G]|nr:amino acid carrier protein [Peptoniphilus sp. ING2-D1G]
MLDNLTGIITSMNDVLWGLPLMVSLVGFGILSTIYLSFPQIKRFGYAFKQTFGGLFSKDTSDESSLSSFQALATAIAAQVGTGNIGGVAGAIVAGGPGAVFWMWVTAIVGMSTISVEAILAQKYREKRDGKLIGGPAFYISKGLKNRGLEAPAKFLSTFFAVLSVLTLGWIGSMVQSNSISSALNEAFGIPLIVSGVIIATLAGFIYIGGIKRIGSFAEKVVPVMAVLYIIGSIIVLFKFNHMIIPVFTAIFEAAFSSKAVLGGAVGVSIKTAIRYGVARGLFSNEAGMGSTPNSHAVANVEHPVVQGCVAMVGVFIDTILICTATAVVILATGANNSGKEGVMITMEGFNIAFGDIGSKFLAIALVFFAFTTIVGWYYFGETNAKFLTKSKTAIRIYQVLAVLFIVLGSLQKVEFVWQLTDLFTGLLVIPNVIGLLILLKEVKELYNDFDRQMDTTGTLKYNYKD